MRFKFESEIFRWFYYLYSCPCGESRLLVSWCVGDKCGMSGSDENCDRSRKPDAEDRVWSHMSGTQWPNDREVVWCCVRSAPYIWRWESRVSWSSLKTRVNSLSVVWTQNHWDSFLRFDIKTSGDVFSRFNLKIGGGGFSVYALKPVVLVWSFEPQNQCDGFLVCTSKPHGLWFVGCSIKIDGRMKTVRDTRRDLTTCFTWKQASRASVSSLGSRLVVPWRGWCTLHHRVGCVEVKLKTDGSMRWVLSDSATIVLPFSMY
jgi:hypothetical protein